MCYREFILPVVLNFGQSLIHGNTYIYQSMPRMLTLWLDYGAEIVEYETRSGRNRSEVASQAMKAVIVQLNKVNFQHHLHTVDSCFT